MCFCPFIQRQLKIVKALLSIHLFFSHRLIQLSRAVIDPVGSGGDLLNRDGEAKLKEVTKPGRDENTDMYALALCGLPYFL